MQYDPPGNLPDFNDIPQQRDKWHEFIQWEMRNAISKLPVGTPQFYDATKEDVGDTFEQDIVWNAFPKELLRRFGRERALREADTLWPLPAYQLGWRHEPGDALPSNSSMTLTLGDTPYCRHYLYRPQNEYCEWRVEPGPDGRIQRVTFTCEPPEYWQAMYGGSLKSKSGVKFTDAPNRVLELYRALVSPQVQEEDLRAATSEPSPLGMTVMNGYNPFNKWNSTHGIAHLSAPPNALIPEILLASQASRVFRNALDETVVLPDVLMAGSDLGGGNRASDSAIAAAVNALARQGRRITLSNPIGLYMDHIDLAGWQFPGGFRAEDCVHKYRGTDRRFARLVIEVPGSEFDVSDIRIAGEPILYGGQIAECITVKLRATASVVTGIVNARTLLPTSAHVLPSGEEMFVLARRGAPDAAVPAFAHEMGPGLVRCVHTGGGLQP